MQSRLRQIQNRSGADMHEAGKFAKRAKYILRSVRMRKHLLPAMFSFVWLNFSRFPASEEQDRWWEKIAPATQCVHGRSEGEANTGVTCNKRKWLYWAASKMQGSVINVRRLQRWVLKAFVPWYQLYCFSHYLSPIRTFWTPFWKFSGGTVFSAVVWEFL